MRDFATFVNGNMARLNVTAKELSRVCGVPLIHVRQWQDGESAPHPALQAVVVAYLSRPIQSKEAA